MTYQRDINFLENIKELKLLSSVFYRELKYIAKDLENIADLNGEDLENISKDIVYISNRIKKEIPVISDKLLNSHEILEGKYYHTFEENNKEKDDKDARIKVAAKMLNMFQIQLQETKVMNKKAKNNGDGI